MASVEEMFNDCEPLSMEGQEIKQNVVICIYHKKGRHQQSMINEMLEGVQSKLKKKLKNYKEIQIAYVYETNSILDVKEFEKLEENTPIYYKEPCNKEKGEHNLAYVYFMGLAVLEKQLEKNPQRNVENIVYLITDEEFGRTMVNRILYALHARFSHLNFQAKLVKTSDVGKNEDFESYMNEIEVKSRKRDENYTRIIYE